MTSDASSQNRALLLEKLIPGRRHSNDEESLVLFEQKLLRTVLPSDDASGVHRLKNKYALLFNGMSS